MDKLEIWTRRSIIAVLLVITAGAVVRATGSGLGCPDWPRCFGQWVPPTDAAEIDSSYLAQGEVANIAKTWTEYGNRLIGVLVGFIMLYTMILAWRVSRGNKPVLYWITGAALLIPVQAIQGGMVVKRHLDPRLVTVHFILALVILGLLVRAYLAMRSSHAAPKGFLSPEAQPQKMALWARLAMGLTAIQVVLGALVRGSIEIVVAESEGLPRGEWLSQVGLIDWIHRDAAVLITFLVAILAWKLKKSGCQEKVLLRSASLAVGLVVLQCLAGVVMAYGDLPPSFQVIHITLATWLMTALFFQERLLAAECELQQQGA